MSSLHQAMTQISPCSFEYTGAGIQTKALTNVNLAYKEGTQFLSYFYFHLETRLLSVTNLSEQMFDGMTDRMSGMLDGMSSMLNTVNDMLNGVFDWCIELACRFSSCTCLASIWYLDCRAYGQSCGAFTTEILHFILADKTLLV